MLADSVSPKIVVLGSINMDLVACCPALPLPGQTLTAESLNEIPGGKGANQAVAASRAGGQVSMIARLGTDGFADRLASALTLDGINIDSIQRSEGPSGVAMITVAHSGENQIVVVPGANGCLSKLDVDQHAKLIAEADFLLLQLEVPMDCVVHAIQVARHAGTRVILDPAPVPQQWPNELFDVDLICPNQTEMESLTGIPVESPEQMKIAAKRLQDRGACAIAITLGAAGTLLCEGENHTLVEPFRVDPRDTTAAGDAFAGAVAVKWAQTGSLTDAIRFGNAAGAVAASRMGAQPSLPTREEIETQLNQMENHCE